jgi:hypothetical protein
VAPRNLGPNVTAVAAVSLEGFTAPMPMTGAADDQDWSQFERLGLLPAVNGRAESGDARRGPHYRLVIIIAENEEIWFRHGALRAPSDSREIRSKLDGKRSIAVIAQSPAR